MAYCFTSFFVLLITLTCASSSHASGTFDFDIHHRYSDPVKGILDVDDLPEKGSYAYYSALAHRDRVFRVHGRGLATETNEPLTFEYGNKTYSISALGFLYYANVSLGTPALSYFVALDTGSDLFWLPCDCKSCVHGLNFSTGEMIDFNIYSPNASSTSSKVNCSSTLCESTCLLPMTDACPYQVHYSSAGTSSRGYLVEDTLHLITNDDQSKSSDSRISFGCGRIQTGSLLNGVAPNGVFGLGMGNISVPSILASQKLIPNSFSMCFGSDGIGRISFGDQGSSDQGETPFDLRQSDRTYNITITRISVGGTAADLEFSATFDSGAAFTYLNDPAYTKISESFNSQAKEKRFTANDTLPFEYCYVLSANQTDPGYPVVDFTMKGGDPFLVNDPIVFVLSEDINLYCLGVFKSDDVNIIGQNFIAGHNIVFDREKNVLGWKPSNCYDDKTSVAPVSPPKASAIPPATAISPEASRLFGPTSNSPKLLPFTSALVVMILIPFFAVI